MKKVLFLSLLTGLIILFAACSNSDSKEKNSDSFPKELLSKGKEYSIVAVGKDIDHPEEIKGLEKVRYFSSVKGVNSQYPDLKVKDTPYFIVFNDKKSVLKTSKQDKAIKFIEDNY
ncbi:hypothetical protein [Priestia megaterium]|uniref:hypothetical protein n=1 Tax=Priestia megaterium TaxID=1404 RepID=UPI0024467D5B|nr:hypothetical protein [Priestia megaterium]MDP1443311.1 hypothetical protein [Priestia megaterium]MDP1472462.1 hypothetical protein [Priestia megaterium]WRQ90330.1 hypothetical protein NQ126_000125 [Priestia megaterium]WRQ90339.1 hypothetical protein NQ126_000080 [Priestia megaterium]